MIEKVVDAIIKGNDDSIINDVNLLFEGHRKIVRTNELAVKGYLSEYVQSTKEEMSREFLPDITDAINSFNNIIGERYYTSDTIIKEFEQDVSQSGIDEAIESVEFSLFAQRQKINDAYFKFLEDNIKVLSKPFTVLHTPTASWPKDFDFPKPAKIEMPKNIYKEANNITGRKEWLEYVIKYTRDDVRFRIKQFNIETDYLTKSVIKVADLIEKLKNYRRKFDYLEKWNHSVIKYELTPSINTWNADSKKRERKTISIIEKGAEILKTDYMDYLRTTIQVLSGQHKDLDVPVNENERFELAMQLYTNLPRGKQITEPKPSDFRNYIAGTLKNLVYSAIDDIIIESPDKKSSLIKLYTPLSIENRVCDIEIYGK